MGAHRGTSIMRSVQAKLLVLLVVLSLPLLVVSLLQIRDHGREAVREATTISDLQSAIAAVTLNDWLEDRFGSTAPQTITEHDATRSLYAHIYDNITPAADTAIAVIDAEGRIVANPLSQATISPTQITVARTEQVQWSDGVSRLTSVRLVEPYKWRVMVGIPVVKSTSGSSALWLTATWALALAASILLAIWAVGRFTKPLRHLASSASTLGEGRLQERVIVETKDEVGSLAESFNDMAGRLETKFAELHTQSAFIEDILDSLPLGVAVLDEKLIVQKANRAFAHFVERDAKDLRARGIYEASAGLASLREIVEDVRRTRRPFVSYGLPLELVARRGDKEQSHGKDSERENGSYWDVVLWPTTEHSSARGDLILLLSEVSKRVRAERLATIAFANERARAAELESVIKQMAEGVIIVDPRGQYRVNPAAMTILGKRATEFREGVDSLIEDIGLRAVNDERALKPEDNPLRETLERGERIENRHVKIIRGDGQKRVLSISATPLLSEANKREGMIAVLRDITDEVRQHNELLNAYERLREHDRLKSAFVANVSHELRTPLNVIIGMCQVLARDRNQPLAQLQTEAVARMNRNARNLLALVNDLLDYSRLEAGRSALHLEKTNINEVIEEVISSQAHSAEVKKIELVAVANPVSNEPLIITTDRRKVAQVFSNLVSNAIKFTQTGGRVTIEATPISGDRWSLEVRDNGIGMSPDEISFVFDEFRQADEHLARRYGGVGLGLAITRKIVELLEGEITVESEPGKGSLFRITWPRTPRPRTGTGSLVSVSENLRVQRG
jgi:PAS domain S-box-containing protein